MQYFCLNEGKDSFHWNIGPFAIGPKWSDLFTKTFTVHPSKEHYLARMATFTFSFCGGILGLPYSIAVDPSTFLYIPTSCCWVSVLEHSFSFEHEPYWWILPCCSDLTHTFCPLEFNLKILCDTSASWIVVVVKQIIVVWPSHCSFQGALLYGAICTISQDHGGKWSP